MRFTHKLTVGFGLVAALALAMLGVFFLTLRQYERSDHLVFLLNHVRSREQALHTSMLRELHAVKVGMERLNPAFTDRERGQAQRTTALMAEILNIYESLARDLGRLSSFPKDRLLFFTRLQKDLKAYEQRLAHTQTMIALTPGADRTSAPGACCWHWPRRRSLSASASRSPWRLPPGC